MPTFEELKTYAANNDPIGKGALGAVYRYEKGDQCLFAIKVGITERRILSATANNFQHEADVLTKLKENEKCNDYILCFNSHVTSKDKKVGYLVTEFLTGYEPLSNYHPAQESKEQDSAGSNYSDDSIDSDDEEEKEQKPPKKTKNLKDELGDDVFHLYKKLIEGLTFIQKQGIAHLDIKPANIMVNIETLSIKYIDFGSACDYVPPPPDKIDEATKYDQCVRTGFSPFAAAPELLNTEKWFITLQEAQKADIWSLGVSIYMCHHCVDINTPGSRHKFIGGMVDERKLKEFIASIDPIHTKHGTIELQKMITTGKRTLECITK